jgi:hypothetical protein
MNFGYLSDGSWEAAVTDVVIAGQPKVVHTISHRWITLGHAMPDYAKTLQDAVDALCGGKHGWHGPAAKAYEKVVTQLAKEIGKLSDDCAQLGGHIDDAGEALSTAIAGIPVPVDKDTTWYGDVDHRLPGGAKFDDSLHRSEKFRDTLVGDYQQHRGSYHNFLSGISVDNAGSRLSNARVARQGADDYSGQAPDHAGPAPGQPAAQDRDQAQRQAIARRVAAWYNANAATATKAFRELKSHYTDQRDSYREIADRSFELQLGAGRKKSGGGDDGYTGYTGAAGSYGPGSGYVTTPDGSRFHPDVPDHLAQGLQLPGAPDTSTVDDHGRTDLGATRRPDLTGLAGHGGSPTGATFGGAGLGGAGGGGIGAGGFGGGLPDAGVVPGLVRPGSATSGPSMSPAPPLTSPRDAILGPNARTAARGSTGPTGMGMMPHGGGRQGAGRDERSSWLTEDDQDIWRGVPLGPPSVIE